MNSISKELFEWGEDVVSQCGNYSKQIDLDYYCFQTPMPESQVDFLIIGINPGGQKSYNEAMDILRKELGKEVSLKPVKRLAQDCNLYSVKNPHPDNNRMVSKLSRVFHTSTLVEALEHSTAMNIYYFNTTNTNGLNNHLCEEIKSYCRKKTLEAINIMNPKHILFLCTNNHELSLMGVKNIKGIGNYMKEGELGGKRILAMPNPGFYRAFSYKNGEQMGTIIAEYLSQ